MVKIKLNSYKQFITFILYDMELPVISIEQNNIISQLLLNNNVVVDSVAGSGKTTCNLHIAKHFKNMNILLLTYNSKLKLETREKAKKFGITNIEVHSYHSFCVKYYDNQCYTDTIINKIITKKIRPMKKFNFDLIVPDEAQDITSLYYELICKIYKDNSNINANVCIFGDKNQSIFDFNKADQRFIEFATDLFNFNSNKWVKCNLPVSFRITSEMSLFINKCLLKEERIISNKITNNKPRYIICDCFGDKLGISSRTFEEVKYYFNLGYKPSDIFILAPSIKGGNSPIRQLENKIKRELAHVMIYIPTNDDEKLDDDLLEGKLIFSTFHQAKGLERKVVIIFNFDNSYFEFYKKDANPCICSNELYVATTRGIDHLTLFHHYNNDYFRFIDKTNISLYCYFENTKLSIKSKTAFIKNVDTSITELIKFLPQYIIDECFDELEVKRNKKYVIDKIDIPLKISNEDTIEGVSEITGIAIPSMFEFKLKNRMSIFDKLLEIDFEKNIINNSCNDITRCTHTLPKQKKHNINNINIYDLKSEDLLYLSNCWNTYKNGYLFKIYQITNYDWLPENLLHKCVLRLSKLNISINSIFECGLTVENKKELLNRKLIGYIDCIDDENNIVYEFKCVQKLEKEHYLQLAIYMYMYELEKEKRIICNSNKYKTEIRDLLNIKKDITNKILINNKKLDEIIIKSIIDLLHIKVGPDKKLFINNKMLINCKNNVDCKDINEYSSIRDKIKYTLFNEEICKIVKIYKTKGSVETEGLSNLLIFSIRKHLEFGVIKNKINYIEDELHKLNNELIDINQLIDDKMCNRFYLHETKYVLFNILTNEHISIKCEFQKLKNMIKYLVHSKYINDKPITDEEFIKNNRNIFDLYFI